MRVPRRYLALAVVALLSAVPMARSAPEGEPATQALAGQLLIATPDMSDPRFQHTVILMVEHDQSGALGIVINRPLGAMPIAKLLAAMGQDASGATGTIRVYAGGPVQPDAAFILHSADYHTTHTIAIDGQVSLTVDPKILRDIGHGKGPKKRLIAFGYAGWGPGQLEGEIARHSWFTAPDDPKLIFDDPPGRIWHDAMARRTQNI